MTKTTAPITVEISRAGTFRSAEGDDIALTPALLQGVADAYSLDADAPAVIGHPEADMPAYGWVTGLTYDKAAQKLLATIDDIDPAFAEAIKTRKYKKISAAFFMPHSPANPKPGQIYLRHVGFLGAAAPAVPDLKSVQFALRLDRVF